MSLDYVLQDNYCKRVGVKHQSKVYVQAPPPFCLPTQATRRQFSFSLRATWEPVRRLFSFTDLLFDQNIDMTKNAFLPSLRQV